MIKPRGGSDREVVRQKRARRKTLALVVHSDIRDLCKMEAG
nr:hypothetical protein [Bradyrhizobium sp. ORS 278]